MKDDLPVVRPRLPHLLRETTRHGTLVWYFRKERNGKRIRLPEEYGSEEFLIAYNAALTGNPVPVKIVTPQTLEWAVDLYRRSPSAGSWSTELGESTRQGRERMLQAIVKANGDIPLVAITKKKILQGRDLRKNTPHQANEFVKIMRHFFKWASDPGQGNLIEVNPAIDVKKLATDNPQGWRTWTDEDVALFERYWAVGTRERLALDILLYTGLRRSDAVNLGKQHIKNNQITIRVKKKTNKKGVTYAYPPVLPVLAKSIAATKTGDLHFLVNDQGRAYAAKAFGTWFSQAAKKAGCPVGCSAHGLRKAAAVRCAENGATVHQMMAIFAWNTPEMALHYTKAANDKRIAAAGSHLMLPVEEIAPHLPSGAAQGAKT